MNQKKIIETFVQLSSILASLGDNKLWSGYDLGITESEFNKINEVVKKQFFLNGWFTEINVRKSLKSWSEVLNDKKLSKWLEDYTYSDNPKRVGIIMAGNIPLVGFHDFISVILSGNIAVIKLSSDDKTLLPSLVEIIQILNPDLSERIEICEAKINSIDAVIATGSNNSMHYFEQYFGKYPHVFRKNRTSIAIIKGNETKEELALLGEDIFAYFGLGCRNVSQVFLPKNYNIDKLIESIISHSEVVNHHKYANNYDYNKAINLMNLQKILDNGFLLFKETNDLFSPLAMLYYHFYENQQEIDEFINSNKENIQAIVGKDYLPFGTAQKPELNDYADGFDTVNWLSKL